jgi:rfaE bifunctional protein kinase chain/domain
MRLKPGRAPATSRLLALVDRLAVVPAVVWGDFVLDEYWRCLSRRVSREAPVLILDYQSRAVQGGGAANAALNLAALGARVHAVGFVGDDEAGAELRRQLDAAGVDTAGLIVHDQSPTVVKTRIVAGSVHTALQQVVRVDRGRPFAPHGKARDRLGRALREAARDARAVILSDYGYGTVGPALARRFIGGWRRRGLTIGLDARYRLASYRGVTLATPNESEAAAAAVLEVNDDRDLERAAARLLRRLAAGHLLITRGRDGLTLWNGNGGVSLEAWGGEEAVDVTGAGDAVIATATLALAAGAVPLAAAALANAAGSVAVSRRGTVAVSATALRRALRRGGRIRAGAKRS